MEKDNLTALAEKLGLQVASFEQCLAAGRHRAAIEVELEEARKVGIDRTPTLIINGQLHPGGLSVEDFRGLLDRESEQSRERK